MRFGVVVLLPIIAVGCGVSRPPQLRATASPHAPGIVLVARDAEDDLTFQVPVHSLDRCIAAAQVSAPDVDPSPRLAAPWTVRQLRTGCDNEMQANARGVVALHAVRLHLVMGPDGAVTKAEVEPNGLRADTALENCLLASARRTVFPRNLNGKPYEMKPDIVYFYSYIGETRWKMLETVQRLDAPSQETCQCIAEHPAITPQVFTASFTIPEASGPTRATKVQTDAQSPLAQCFRRALGGIMYYGRGATVDATYTFSVVPSAAHP